MIRLFNERRWPWAQPKELHKIDLGNGKFLAAADLLEGHFHRLATATVPVQVDRSLTAAITVLAPDLTPLTTLAEEVAQTVLRVQPAPHFRHQLQQALEQTHRQHTAQRVLGTRQAPPPAGVTWLMFSVCVALVITVVGVWRYRQQGRRAQAGLA
ncbi:MAG: hypothetical protein M3Q45_12600 [Chloroflexota bacterium]|nr:hypothetical protein [Chloroflexota bacterium]